MVSTAWIWLGVSCLWNTSSLRGPSPQALTLLRGVRLITWHLKHLFLRECRQGLRHFWEYQACLNYGPTPGPTLKKVLCYTCPFGGVINKYRYTTLHKLLIRMDLVVFYSISNHVGNLMPNPIYKYIHLYARGVMVIVIGNGHVDTSSNPG